MEEEGWCPSTGDLGGIGRNRAGFCSSGSSSSDAGTPISESSPSPSFALSFPFPLVVALTGLFFRACFVGLSAPSLFSPRQTTFFELSAKNSSSSSSYLLLMVLRSRARRPLTAGRDPRREVLLTRLVELIERVRIDEGWAVEGVLDLLAMEGVVEEDMVRICDEERRSKVRSTRREEGRKEGTMDGGPGEGMSERSEAWHPSFEVPSTTRGEAVCTHGDEVL